MQLSGKKAVVVGLGKTGLATTQFLTEHNASVTVTDSAAPSQLSEMIPAVQEMGAKLELGQHIPETFENADLIVVSPGVPHTLTPIQLAKSKGIIIIGEIELAARFINVPIIAVTGTNGKTTTTEILASMLSHSGFKVFMGGNIGTPLIDYVVSKQVVDFVVVEVSSFQLDTIDLFKPHIALLLNISEDHLDRYDTIEAYVQSKGRIFKNQSPNDVAIVNRKDKAVRRLSEQVRSRVLFFNAQSEYESGAVIRSDAITFNMDPDTWLSIDTDSINLTGNHNLENSAAAGLATLAAGGNINGISTALSQFKVPSHRLEYVTSIKDVSFYDDSKATNVDAVLRALETFDDSVIILMGGRDKGGNYSILEDAIKAKVKQLILIGEAKQKIRTALGHLTITQDAETMEAAVNQAYQAAQPGDTILLSPACASFDMFDSYGQRGAIFQEAVRQLET